MCGGGRTTAEAISQQCRDSLTTAGVEQSHAFARVPCRHTRVRAHAGTHEQAKHPPAGPLACVFVSAQNQVPIGMHRGHTQLRQ